MSFWANLTENRNFFFQVFEISITVKKNSERKEQEAELSKNSPQTPCLPY